MRLHGWMRSQALRKPMEVIERQTNWFDTCDFRQWPEHVRRLHRCGFQIMQEALRRSGRYGLVGCSAVVVGPAIAAER